jgi:predicted DNA binding CopG/RHH family protein
VKEVKKERDKQWAHHYDQGNILDELLEEPVEFSLGERLRRDIFSKKRKRKLQNVTIKMDPLQVQAIRKLATTKSIPYQTLIRHYAEFKTFEKEDFTGETFCVLKKKEERLYGGYRSRRLVLEARRLTKLSLGDRQRQRAEPIL